ncbi:MAG: ATP synthase F1 subunit delta [Ignavibacteriaceae bacterium]|nr:ATP synthase F1 subunit delta [Ignavibacteriaceae bacterium]
MADYKVSYRYANSLLDLALEKKMIDSISSDMEFLQKTLKENPALKRALSNPVIKSHLKIKLIDEIFKDKVDNETIGYLKFLVKKGRENLLDNIVSAFLEIKDDHLGIANVEVVVASQLSGEQIESLRKKFEAYLNKKVRLNIIIDEKIIGGFVAKVKDTVFDASIRHQLQLLKKQLIQGGAILN